MRFSKTYFLFLIFFSIQSVLFAQNQPDDIVGYYLVKDPFSPALSQIYIYDAGNGTYEGVVVWVDQENQKKNEGLLFLKGMTFNAPKNEWQNITMIYPGKNWKFSAYMRFVEKDRLRVRGYLGVTLLGKTEYFTKEKESRNPKVR